MKATFKCKNYTLKDKLLQKDETKWKQLPLLFRKPVSSGLVITCGTGPAGTETRL